MIIKIDKDVAKKIMDYAYKHHTNPNEIANTLLRTEMEHLSKVKEQYK